MTQSGPDPANGWPRPMGPPVRAGDQHAPGPLHQWEQPAWGSRHRTVGGYPPPPAMAIKPGIVPLAPLNLGTILSAAFAMYRANPRAVILVPLVLFGVLSLVFAPVTYLLTSLFPAADPTNFGLVVSTVPYLGQGLAGLVATATMVPFVAIAVHAAALGRKASVAEIWERSRRRIPAVLGYTLLVGLVSSVPFAVAMTPFLLVLQGNPMDNIGVIIALVAVLGLAAVVFVVWFGTKSVLGGPAITLEGLGPIAAIRRSFRLTAGAFWPILGTYLLASLIASVAQQVLWAIPGLPLALGTAFWWDQYPALIGAATVLPTLLSVCAVLPFSYAVVTLIYLDRRIRQEAYDVTLAQQAAPVPDAAVPAPPPYAGPPAAGPPRPYPGAPNPYGVWDPRHRPGTAHHPPHDPDGRR